MTHTFYILVDVNECEATNNGQGPCEDLCENTIGAYLCGCSVPGFEITSADPHKCIGV